MRILFAEDDRDLARAVKALLEHAHEYGFIQRYPANKADVTGISYEPWHYRYVGVDAATRMHRSGQTLEEFLAGK